MYCYMEHQARSRTMTGAFSISRTWNLPYVFAFYFADKIAAVFRLAPGTEFIDKLTNGFAVFGTAFANPLPSFHPVDLLIGLSAGVLLKLAVYVKGKNRKKFRQGEEYGSARWSA